MSPDRSPASIEATLADFLRNEVPYAYCDACLAFTLHLDLDPVRIAAEAMAASGVSERLDAECSQCDRFAVVTCWR
jgi:hypothetical protein